MIMIMLVKTITLTPQNLGSVSKYIGYLNYLVIPFAPFKLLKASYLVCPDKAQFNGTYNLLD